MPDSVQFPRTEHELVCVHVHSFSTEPNTLHLEPQPLVKGPVGAQFDLASRAHNTLPWKRAGVEAQ